MKVDDMNKLPAHQGKNKTIGVEKSNESSSPGLREILKWITSITKPLHSALLVSLFFRIINLLADWGLFFLAGAGIVEIIRGEMSLAKVFIGLIILSLIKATAYYLEQFSGHYVAFKALELLRTKMFASLWPKAPKIMEYSRSGDLLASLTRDIDRIEVLYAHTFAPVVSAFLAPALLLSVIAYLGGREIFLTTLCLLLISLLLVPFLGFKASYAATRKVLSARRSLTHHLSDTVYGMDEVIGYGLGQARLDQIQDWETTIRKHSGIAKSYNATRRALNVGLSLLTAVLVLLWGIYSGVETGILAGLVAGSLRLYEGPRGFEDAVGYLDHSFASARRLYQIAHSEQVVKDGEKLYAPQQAPEVSWNQITYSYRNHLGEELGFKLDNLSLCAPAGKHTVIVGASGCGKSTLVKLLSRFDNLESGSITLDGVNITDYTLDSLRQAVVLVSQKNQQMQDTILANLRLGNPTASENEIWETLELVGLAEEIRSMPAALETVMGDDGKGLSGGQAQRLCLARALLMKPKVLVLDEFSANLNTELEGTIRDNLAKSFPELTIIEITHRLEQVLSADKIVLMDQGKIVDEADREDIATGEHPLLQHLLNRDV